MSSVRVFEWPSSIPVPRNSRQIDQPVDGSSVRLVSDLIPTQAITESFPALGQKYGTIFYTNQTRDRRFENYEFYRMTREPGDYTRLHFLPASGDVDSGVAFKTIWTYDSSVYWPKIVERMDFFGSDAELVAGAPGYFHGTPDTVWTITQHLRPAYKGLTKLRIRQYLSTFNPFDFSASTQTSFTPTNIYWNLIGANGRGETGEALHPEIYVPGCDTTDSQRFVWNEDDPNGRAVGGAERTGRTFFSTEGLDSNVFVGSTTHLYLWQDQIIDDKVTPLNNGLYLREIVDAFRPEPENEVEEYQS